MTGADKVVIAAMGAMIARGLVHLFLVFRLVARGYGRRPRLVLILEMRTK